MLAGGAGRCDGWEGAPFAQEDSVSIPGFLLACEQTPLALPSLPFNHFYLRRAEQKVDPVFQPLLPSNRTLSFSLCCAVPRVYLVRLSFPPPNPLVRAADLTEKTLLAGALCFAIGPGYRIFPPPRAANRPNFLPQVGTLPKGRIAGGRPG